MAAGRIAEKVGKEKWGKLVRDRVCEPLGMKGVAFTTTDIPKDADRAEWLQRQGDPDAFLYSISGETLFSVALFLLVAVVWLTIVPERSPRRRPPSR